MKVMYLGKDESIDLQDGDETVTVAQGQTGEVSDATGQKLKGTHGHLLWFGDEPEPQHRTEGAEAVMPEDGARTEMIEAGARAEGTSVEEAEAQVTVVSTIDETPPKEPVLAEEPPEEPAPKATATRASKESSSS